eukprot:Skav231170  [mRNA]  locus=scaffold3252:311661:317917:- [translate_table: standard]
MMVAGGYSLRDLTDFRTGGDQERESRQWSQRGAAHDAHAFVAIAEDGAPMGTLELFAEVVSVTAAVQGVVWVLVLTVVTLYAMGILTTRLIGHKMLFDASDSTDDALTAPFKTAFVFFMVTSSWTLLSILTAVVSENMISTTSGQEKEILLIHVPREFGYAPDAARRKCMAKDPRWIHGSVFDRLSSASQLDSAKRKVFAARVRERDLIRFLQNTNNAQQTAKMCRVPVRHVQEVMKTLAINSEVIRA